GRSECVVLESGVLVAGGDPGVAEIMSHTQKRIRTRVEVSEWAHRIRHCVVIQNVTRPPLRMGLFRQPGFCVKNKRFRHRQYRRALDRKSTRLNSSHVSISY